MAATTHTISLPPKQQASSPTSKLSPHATVSLDIGGTLTKILIHQPNEVPVHPLLLHFRRQNKPPAAPPLSLSGSNITFHFFTHPTTDIHTLQNMLSTHNSNTSNQPIFATGGGSVKYHHAFSKRNMHMSCLDEMACTVAGLNFLLNKPFTSPTSSPEFPYLLVNVGTGISVLKVESQHVSHRIGGTPLGGGTFMALARLILGATSFNDVIRMASAASHENVDITVADIYGADYSNVGLDANMIASCLGNLALPNSSHSSSICDTLCHGFWRVCYSAADLCLSSLSSIPYLASLVSTSPLATHIRSQNALESLQATGHTPNDVARALVRMISSNIAHVAYLYANIHSTRTVYLGGSFVASNSLIADEISRTVRKLSGGHISVIVPSHAGMLGVLGAVRSGLLNKTASPEHTPESGPQPRHASSTSDNFRSPSLVLRRRKRRVERPQVHETARLRLLHLERQNARTTREAGGEKRTGKMVPVDDDEKTKGDDSHWLWQPASRLYAMLGIAA